MVQLLLLELFMEDVLVAQERTWLVYLAAQGNTNKKQEKSLAGTGVSFATSPMHPTWH